MNKLFPFSLIILAQYQDFTNTNKIGEGGSYM